MLVLAFACTPGTAESDPPLPTGTEETGTAPDTEIPGDTSGTTPPTPSGGCDGSGTPGSYEGTVPSPDGPRTYLLEVPPAHDGVTPVPLVVDLHGTFLDAGAQRLTSNLDDAAREDGFVAVWPDSLSPGGVKAFALTCDSNDVTFIADLLDTLEEGLCIDTSRIVVTGLSNGGYFSNILGSVLAPRIAAIAPVAGGPGVVQILCRPEQPMTATIVHGTSDDIVAFSEGEATRDLWAEVNGCPAPSVDADGCQVTGPCDDGTSVRFCVAEGVGHLLVYQQYPTSDRIRELVGSL